MELLKFKIVMDSSADALPESAVAHASVPLKIITSEKEYIDDSTLDTRTMIEELAAYSGKSSTSCPNPGDFLAAYEGAENIFCITITGTLSGSYNSACIAKREYEEKYPERHVYVIDSLSTGPELRLIAECIAEGISEGKDFYDIAVNAAAYQERTGLIFMLESLKNLANNGRVSPLVARFASVLGIRVIGKASERGDLEPLEKCRGGKKALAAIIEIMEKEGYSGGKVKIAHCMNEVAAKSLCVLIRRKFPAVKPEIYPCGGLCSFYAEKGGLLVGFEKACADAGEAK